MNKNRVENHIVGKRAHSRPYKRMFRWAGRSRPQMSDPATTRPSRAVVRWLAPARWTQARKHQFLQPAYSPSHIVVVSLSEPCPESAVCRQEVMWVASPGLALLNANLVANLPPQLIWCFFPDFCCAVNILSAGGSHRPEHLYTEVELITHVEFIECFHG
jgi:hypothetical protein